MSETLVDFVKAAKDFCAFIESNVTESSISYLRTIQMHLQALYSGGQRLQSVDLTINESFDDVLTKTELNNILNSTANKLDKNRFYWHVFDPINGKDTEPVCGDLLDDLGDIYKELKNAILLFDKGTPAAIENVAWTMKWSYDSHWGDHYKRQLCITLFHSTCDLTVRRATCDLLPGWRDVVAISSNLSRPEISWLKSNLNGFKRSNYSGVFSHGMRLSSTSSQIWYQPNSNLKVGLDLSRGS